MSSHKIIALGSVLCIYIILFFALDGLKFEVTKDEKHFWPTSQRLVADGFPSLDQLRTYNEMTTPLPFLIFGGLDRWTHLGILAGRLFNFILSLGIVFLILFMPEVTKSSVLSTAGLLICPYYLFISTHLYTDMIAIAFVLLGTVLYLREKHLFSGLSFILAIASRQQLVAFPLAILAWEFFNMKGKEFRFKVRWISPLLAALSFAGWFIFFKGPAPPVGLSSQQTPVDHWFPQNSLYFFTCAGIYYVVLESAFFFTSPLKSRLPSNTAWAVLIAVLFLFFPPSGNEGFYVSTMGLFDRLCRSLLNDTFRIILFSMFAILTCFRFNIFSLQGFFVLSNAIIMLKVPLIWEKYSLPLLVVLWYLKSREQESESEVSLKLQTESG